MLAVSGCDSNPITVDIIKEAVVMGDTEPLDNPSFSDMLENPELYIDRILTFDAVVKSVDKVNNIVELRTKDPKKLFFVVGREVTVYGQTFRGKRIFIEPTGDYEFYCRIFEVQKYADDAVIIQAEFIISNDEIVNPPVIISIA